MYVSYWSAPYHAAGEITAFGENMSAKSDYNYKTYFVIQRENLQFQHQNIVISRPTLDSTSVGAKTPDTKTPAMESTRIGAKTSDPKTTATGSSACKGKAQKEYLTEYPQPDPRLSESSSSEYDSSDENDHKSKRCN